MMNDTPSLSSRKMGTGSDVPHVVEMGTSVPVPTFRPPWPWLGIGAILLALTLTLVMHLQRPSPVPKTTQTLRRPTVEVPKEIPPPPPPPQNTGRTPSHAKQPSLPAQSLAEALSGGDDMRETPPNLPDPATKKPGNIPYASNLNLFKAVKRKDLAEVRKLLATFPALVNMRNHKGATGLQLAAVQDDVEIVRFFLASGAEVDATCNLYLYAGQTALHLTAGLGYTGVAALLLAHGAKVNAGNFTGETPLHEAAIQGRNAMVTLLLRHGANIDARQHDGYTPLLFAEINNHPDTVKLLVARGANVNARAADGATPATFAEMLGNKEIATFLRRHGGK